jgi:hypothetical protein
MLFHDMPSIYLPGNCSGARPWLQELQLNKTVQPVPCTALSSCLSMKEG